VQRDLLRGFEPKGETKDPDASTAAHAAHAAVASSAGQSKGDSPIIKRVAKGTTLRVRKRRSLVSDEVGLLRSGAVFAFSEIDGEWAKLSPIHYLDLQSSTICVASHFAPHDPDTEGYCIMSTPDFPATLEEPSETERAAVLEKIAKPDLSGEGGGGDDDVSSATLTPEAIEAMKQPFVVGCKVQLAPGFLSCGDARDGPLKPGDIGTLVTMTDSRYRVQFNGGVWWYDLRALELAEEQQLATGAAQVSQPAVSLSAPTRTLQELADDQDGDFQTPQRAGTCYYRCILAAFNVMLKRRGFDGNNNVCPLNFVPVYIWLLKCHFLETTHHLHSIATQAGSLCDQSSLPQQRTSRTAQAYYSSWIQFI
jgi:hypothetical protein